jgi:hypothetical protein
MDREQNRKSKENLKKPNYIGGDKNRMKGKISYIWRVVIALVLASSLGMVMAAPAAASPDLSEVSITVSPPTATATAEYKIDFFVHTGLTNDYNCFVVEFPTGTTVPATIATGNVKIYDITAGTLAQTPSSVVVDNLVTKPGMAKRVRVYMSAITGGIAAFHYGRVVFTLGAGIKNPAATGVQTFRAWVYTDEEPNPVYDDYEIYQTVPIDVFLKYQIPPVECGYIVYIPVDSFLTIGEALDFVDDLYTSGTTAVFTLKGVKYNTSTPWYGTWSAGWTHGTAIGDTLWAKDISSTENESFDVTYNLNDGSKTTTTIDIAGIGNVNIASNVVDVVSVVGSTGGTYGAGTTPGYQDKFNLTGDTYNTAAGAYGNFGKTTAGAWTDGTSIGEALTVGVTTNPTTNPETYKVTYNSDNATSGHIASLTVLTDGTYVWSPAAPTNVVDVTGVTAPAFAWHCYTACPTAGGLIGAKVLVKDGTYLETFEIDTPGVEMVSENGAKKTIIDATGIAPEGSGSRIAAVLITAGCVTFDGFTVKNAGVGVVGTPDADGNGKIDASGIYVHPTGSEKSSEYIYDAGGSPTGHYCWQGRVNILNNIVYGSQAEGIQAEDACVLVSGNKVYSNLWDGFCGSELFPGIECLDPDGVLADSKIIDNEFYQNGGSGMGTGYTGWTDAGIEIVSAYASPPKTLYIVGNNIHDNTHAGIYLQDGATGDIIVIKFNQIVDNGVFGISTDADNPYRIACVYNNIEGNTDWGIKNWEDSLLVAPLNWWGDLSGPSCGPAPVAHETSQQSDALGKGDGVSHYVVYKWWLTTPFEDVQEDLIRYYGSDCYGSGWSPPTTPIVPLEQGWNTMSTPVALDERADQMGEILALGGWMKNFILGYSYDPASGWQLLTGDFQLVPLEAVYVKMAGPDKLPILLRTTNYMPARNLVAGWNLVSLNAPFWTEGIYEMQVNQALSSIEGSWGNAISPAMPGQKYSWVCTPSTADDYDMYIGDGYWVFITKPTTLAGFRMAPWYLDDWEMDILDCMLPPWMPH